MSKWLTKWVSPVRKLFRDHVDEWRSFFLRRGVVDSVVSVTPREGRAVQALGISIFRRQVKNLIFSFLFDFYQTISFAVSTVEAAEFRAGWTRGRRAFRELTTDGCVRHPAHLETVAARRTGENGRSTRNGREVDTTELELFHNKWPPRLDISLSKYLCHNKLCYTTKTFGRIRLRAG